MKKYLMTLSVLVAVLLMTGCGEKKLVCKMEEGKENAEVTVAFKSGKATTATIKMTMEANSEEEAKQAKTVLESLVPASTEEYTESKVTQKGKTVILTSTLKISEMTDEQIKEELGNVELTKEGMKSHFEGQGYSCK